MTWNDKMEFYVKTIQLKKFHFNEEAIDNKNNRSLHVTLKFMK